MRAMDDTNRSVALITGANKGLGYAAASQLGTTGAAILVGARDERRGKQAVGSLLTKGIDARFVRLDVTDVSSIEEAEEQVRREFGRLDILINNAGINVELDDAGELEGFRPVLERTRRTFETNVFGVVATTLAFASLLEASGRGRVVNVSSHLGSITLLSQSHVPKILAYGASKAALNMVTVILAERMAARRIKVNSACPGLCATEANGMRGARTAEQGARIIVRLATIGEEGPSGGSFDDDGRVPW